VLRQPRLSKQACSTRLPSPTFKNGLVSMRGGHLLTRQRIRTSLFHLINVQTVKVPSNANLSRPMRPSLALCGKRVCLSGDGCRTPTQWHAQRGGTAAHGPDGSHEPAPALHVTTSQLVVFYARLFLHCIHIFINVSRLVGLTQRHKDHKE